MYRGGRGVRQVKSGGLQSPRRALCHYKEQGGARVGLEAKRRTWLFTGSLAASGNRVADRMKADQGRTGSAEAGEVAGEG